MKRKASNAADAPFAAAVITCLSSESVTSPAANNPGTDVRPSWSILMYPLSSSSHRPCRKLARGMHADEDEDAVKREQLLRRAVGRLESQAGDLAVRPDDLDRHAAPMHLDLVVGEAALLDALGRPQLVSAMYQVNPGRELREEHRLFHGRIPAAHDRDHLVSEERAIAGGAPRDSSARELGLSGHAELARHRAGRQDHAASGEHLALAGEDEEPVVVHAELLDGSEVADDGAVHLGLLGHEVAELRARQPVRKARVVLHPVGRHDLAAGYSPLEHDGLRPAPRRVERGSQSARSSADDRDVDDIGWCHCAAPELSTDPPEPCSAFFVLLEQGDGGLVDRVPVGVVLGEGDDLLELLRGSGEVPSALGEEDAQVEVAVDVVRVGRQDLADFLDGSVGLPVVEQQRREVRARVVVLRGDRQIAQEVADSLRPELEERRLVAGDSGLLGVVEVVVRHLEQRFRVIRVGLQRGDRVERLQLPCD